MAHKDNSTHKKSHLKDIGVFDPEMENGGQIQLQTDSEQRLLKISKGNRVPGVAKERCAKTETLNRERRVHIYTGRDAR